MLVVAAADWAIALSLLLTRTETPVAAPLLVLAATVVTSLQAPRLRRVVHAVRLDRRRTRWASVEAALGREWSPRVARLVLREPRLLWSVVLLLRGRRDGVPPAAGFGGHRDALPAWLAIGSVAVVEIAVTALLPLPELVHRVLLVLGVWGAVVVLGLVAALVVHPHLLTDDRLVLRMGFWAQVTVPRASIDRVRLVTRSGARGLSATPAYASLSASGTTNVTLTLSRPVTVDERQVTEVRLWADDPHALRAALRRPSP